MSHRQSCDRCRQQKVRCLRDEAQAQRGSQCPDRAALTPCERCMKAGVDCIYSLKQRPTRHSVQTLGRKETSRGSKNGHSHSLDDTSWFEQSLAGTDFASKATPTQFPGLDHESAAAFNNVNGWDASLQSLLTPATFFNSLSVAPEIGPITTRGTSAALSTAGSRQDSSEGVLDVDNDDNNDDDDRDPLTALSSQLTSLSERARRAIRRLVRPGQTPLTVSSPEVNEALEDTNTLIRIMNNITAPIPDGDEANITIGINSNTTDYGLAFSVLACHQHLVALFRAICDAIHRCCQQGREENRNNDHSSSEIGPSSVAQFIMVLQLLIHLINRMDRSLVASQNQNNPSSTWPGTGLSRDGHGDGHIPRSDSHQQYYALLHSETATNCSSPPGGLLVLVQDIVGTIPNEHEKLRQIIQKLQTEMEHLEFH